MEIDVSANLFLLTINNQIMKKRNLKKLNLSKKRVSKLKVTEIDKVKGGSGVGTTCNTWWDCWLD